MYEQYVIPCKNFGCDTYLRLPSDQRFMPGCLDPDAPVLPAETFWPPDKWKASIVCPRCGSMREYDAADVEICYSAEKENQPRCLIITMGCARSECKRAFQFFMVPVDEDFPCRASAEDIDLNGDIVSLLRDGRIKGKCPRGHELGMLPKELYKVMPHTGTIPSQHEDLHWIQHSSRLIGMGTRMPSQRRLRGHLNP